jgi:hypothetical protein
MIENLELIIGSILGVWSLVLLVASCRLTSLAQQLEEERRACRRWIRLGQNVQFNHRERL